MNAKDGPTFLWDKDIKGFGVKATPSGAKTYVFQYRLGGRGSKTKRYTIGRHGSITPDEARKMAKRLAAAVVSGEDPSALKHQERRERIDLAFKAYGATFLNREMSNKSPGFQTLAEGILRLHVYPVFKDKPLPKIGRSDLAALFDSMPAGKPALRRNTFAILRRLFNWAVKRGDLEDTPFKQFETPPAVASRDRVLSDEEIALAWNAAETLGYPFGPIVQLLFATGQRREEVAAVDWAELDRNQRIWTLPAGRAKNARQHTVPLNDIAISVLDRATKRTGEDAKVWPKRGLVFTTTGEAAVSGFSRAKRRLDAAILTQLGKDVDVIEDEPMEPILKPWRVHDARRTLATGLQRLGVRFEVTEAVLNHVSGSRSGVAAVYQRHDWAVEKRAALDAWGQHIDSLLRPLEVNNIVPISSSSRRS